MDYFNASVMAFEPVIEHWTFRVGVLDCADNIERARRQVGCMIVIKPIVN